MHSNQVPDDPLAQFCSFLIKIESAINVRLFQWSETKPTQQEFNLYFENMIKQIHTAPITDHALGDFLNPEKANTPRKTWNDLTLKPLEFIKQEYKKQLLKIHPDKNPGQEEKYTPIFQAFCKANEILTKIAESLARIESSKLQYLQTQLQTKQVDKKTAAVQHEGASLPPDLIEFKADQG